MAIHVEIEKSFKGFSLKTAFDSKSSATGILGASGSGKSMTLRCISGIEKPDKGKIIINGRTVFDSEKKINLKPQERRIGYLFQNYALFPTMTVKDNIKCGFRGEKGIQDAKVADFVKRYHLDGLENRYPSQLSGGQQQRVALARALVTRPSILLLDEPLSNLDAKLRVEMQVEIKRIQKELGITTIIVTHDHEEAVSLADRVIVMNAGHILQIGKPQEVFDRPASPFIADFMGFSTFLHGIAAGAEGDMRLIRCGAHTLQVPAEAAQELTEGDACILAIRSENIRTAEQEGVNTVRGTVKSATYKGHTTRLEVSGCFEEMVYPAIHEYADVQEGSEVLLHFPAQHFCVYKDIK